MSLIRPPTLISLAARRQTGGIRRVSSQATATTSTETLVAPAPLPTTTTPPVFVKPVPAVPPRRSGGFFRGGVIGFLTGLTLAGSTAYVFLLDEYEQASNALLSGVDNLQKTTAKLREHTAKIEVLEREFRGFVGRAATQKDLERVRAELLKVIDDVNVSHLELKTHVWEVEQDVKQALKK
ncbi:uncharacterized protein EV422DRAFT_542579 [Fimicolochytrium jonesii]|uniref:uncharacterized protein n=1 Tax=Fimicolochytrium jonesii TaxID=1396493 RepID=UPI0022FEFD15|nr:uncharacterized protein EV422DRAFT_542579 [Fimicolochytrium jonesii]KAI8817149.1 hypothetical protein EV422DRAFT_542579 [Fimicolochytrium jonesii]